jgi:hypothetical protein
MLSIRNDFIPILKIRFPKNASIFTQNNPGKINKILKVLGDWKSQLHKQNPPARVQIFYFLLVRVGGLGLYSPRILF